MNKKEKEPLPVKNPLLMLIQSIFAYNLLTFVFQGLHFNVIEDANRAQQEEEWWPDVQLVALAPHRQMADRPDLYPYLFPGTQVSFDGFLEFVQYRSTQARDERDVLMNRNRTQTRKDPSGVIRFTPGKSYSRTIVRKYMSQYLVTELHWCRTPRASKLDGARHYFVNKGLKDYILDTNKTEFTYDEIKEMFDDGSVMNYINELVMLKLRDWLNFLDAYLCEGDPGDCPRSVPDRPRPDWLAHYPFIAEQLFIQEFFDKNRSTELMYEDLMKFWEWDTEGYGYHILKAEGHEYNGSLDYFKTPAHLRGKPNSYDFQFEPKDELRVRVTRKSHLHDAHQLPKEVRFPPLDKPTRLALHVSVSLAESPESYLGHNGYHYNLRTSGLASEALWIVFNDDYWKHFKQRTT